MTSGNLLKRRSQAPRLTGHAALLLPLLIALVSCGGSGGDSGGSGSQPRTPIVTLSATPSAINSGASATLTWSSTDASSCAASGSWNGSKTTAGNQAVSPTVDSTYALECTNSAGSSASSVTILVSQSPPLLPTVTLAAAPAAITTGSSSTLTWSSTDATSCMASGSWSGAQPTAGSQPVTPTLDSSYTLTCSNSTGGAAASTSITVTPLPTVTLTATPAVINSGASSMLDWTTTNATSCTASGSWSGAQSTAGSQPVTPTLDSSYTLTCTNTAGTNAANTTITVNQPVYYPQPEASGGWRSLVTRNVVPPIAGKADILATTGVDWDLLEDAWDLSHPLSPNGTLLVIRNGWIVGEWGSNAPYHIMSITKSLTGLATAKLMDLSDQGQLSQPIGLGSLAHAYLPPSFGASDPMKQQITIEHLLTMSAGISPIDPDLLTLNERMTLPMDAAPGTEWSYSSLLPNLLSMIIQGQTGSSLGDFFNGEIAAAVGAAPLTWDSIDGGFTNGSAYSNSSARELARIAYLVLKRGAWNDGNGLRQVVTTSRVNDLTQWAPSLAGTVYRETPGSTFTISSDAPNHYGQIWWTNRTGIALGAAVPTDAYYMHGYHDNLAIVVPSRNLIVIRLANEGPPSDAAFRTQLMQIVMSSLTN